MIARGLHILFDVGYVLYIVVVLSLLLVLGWRFDV